MINVEQLRDEVVVPALEAIGMFSPAAVNLVVSTAAAESELCFLRQYPEGPAVGLWQMEPATYDWLALDYLARRADIRAKFLRMVTTGDRMPEADEMVWNLRFGAAMCRLRYWTVPESLPAADDVEALGEYWKKHYNTENGKGTVAHFLRNCPTEGFYS